MTAGVLVLVAVAVAVVVGLGVISKLPMIDTSELTASTTLVVVSNRKTNKMMGIQRLTNLLIRDGGCIFSIVGVTGGASGDLRN